MSRARGGDPGALPLGQAALLGLMHGPAELLPISSSAHVSIAPWLLRWRYGELPEATRKSFEVALHAGTAAALLLLPGPGRRLPRGPGEWRLAIAACAPPALAGLAAEGWIERQLGTPAAIASGLVAGSLLMALGDLAAGRRPAADARLADGLWLGLAQAAALAPGVSRRGATESVARLRGFGRRDAAALADAVGLPVVAGAAGLRAIRLLGRGLEPPLRASFAGGAGCAFASTLACARPAEAARGRAMWPWTAWRLLLAGGIALRLRRGSTARRRPRARP